MKSQLSRHLLMSILFIFTTACSTTEPPSEPSEQTAPHEQKKLADRLSAGEDVEVQTSQGSINVSPNVVAITDAGTDNSPGNPPVYNDPWEDFNRAIFAFNNTTYEYVLNPAAEGYRFIVPAVARDKIGNAFNNIREPLNLLSNAAAGQFNEAGANLSRFVINSTLGVFGLFDPADHWFDIKPHKQTIADTLAFYDISAGPYLVLPILGPGDSRGAVSLFTEGVIHPVNYFVDAPASYGIRAFDGFDDYSGQAEIYESLYQKAEDPYIYFRNQYIQGQRRDEYFQYKQSNNDN
ncbi:MlaA family lipoprotein [Salinimonas chungwhensis]|uniref:MlaA family lipoprotein n=1 Tax=Salinimonas chungwhensis TaxID=265425 RepID=UPI0003A1FE7B|nr:VacJ family lipoprotein [Salinimonas chungwhensis]